VLLVAMFIAEHGTTAVSLSLANGAARITAVATARFLRVVVALLAAQRPNINPKLK
jgi:hypothetical protein